MFKGAKKDSNALIAVVNNHPARTVAVLCLYDAWQKRVVDLFLHQLLFSINITVPTSPISALDETSYDSSCEEAVFSLNRMMARSARLMEDGGLAQIIVAVVFGTIAVAAVILRLVSRRISRVYLGMNDWMIVLALVGKFQLKHVGTDTLV